MGYEPFVLKRGMFISTQFFSQDAQRRRCIKLLSVWTCWRQLFCLDELVWTKVAHVYRSEVKELGTAANHEDSRSCFQTLKRITYARGVVLPKWRKKNHPIIKHSSTVNNNLFRVKKMLSLFFLDKKKNKKNIVINFQKTAVLEK